MKENIDELIEKAKEGDQDAFSQLLTIFWQDLFFYVKNLGASDDDAEDITIETFAIAFEKIDTFNEEFKFITWISTIARNKSIDIHRRKQKRLKTERDEGVNSELNNLADNKPSPEDIFINQQKLKELKSSIAQLKPKYQKIIQYRFLDEMSYKEISKLTGNSLTNVKVLILRARKLLIDKLN